MQGKFITFEGIDGAGKSSHIAAVVAYLQATGRTVVSTREPGGTPVGESIRTLFLNSAMNATTELMLVFAARLEHCEKVIWPAMARGDWVVCDRFTDATVAYQGFGRGLSLEKITQLANFTHPHFSPDLTFWFDLAPQVAANRLAKNRGSSDRFEQEQSAFFERVRSGYAHIAQTAPQRVCRIDAQLEMAIVQKQVLSNLAIFLR